MNFSLRVVAWTAFAIAVILLVGSSIFLLRATHALFDSEALVAHTREVQTVLEDLSSRLFEIANSRRGFVITRDQSFLNDYRAAEAQIPQDLRRLRTLTVEQPDRQQEINQLQGDIQSQLDLINSSLSVPAPGAASEREIAITRQNAAVAARARAALQKMNQEEEALLSQRQAESHVDYDRTLRLIFVSFIIAL